MIETAQQPPVNESETYRWQKQWRTDRYRGQKRTTGPAAAQAHVQGLTSTYGMSIRGIAEAAGVAADVVSQLNRGICQGMKVTTERRILAVKAADIYNRPNSRGSVPNVGAHRRIQALMVMGWRHQDLTPRLGFDSGNVNHQTGGWISQRKHQAIKDLYDRLWNTRGPAPATSLGRVAKAGYAPPLAWDDDSIDDPNATPDLGARIYCQGPAPEGAPRHADAVVEDAQFLIDTGYSWTALPERMGTTAHALERTLYRAGRGDLISRAKNMTERLALARAS